MRVSHNFSILLQSVLADYRFEEALEFGSDFRNSSCWYIIPNSEFIFQFFYIIFFSVYLQFYSFSEKPNKQNDGSAVAGEDGKKGPSTGHGDSSARAANACRGKRASGETKKTAAGKKKCQPKETEVCEEEEDVDVVPV